MKRPLLLVLVLTLLAPACRTSRALATVLAPGNAIELELTGVRPRLVVESGGPGYLTLIARGAGFSSTETFGPGTLTQDFEGPAHVELRATGEEPVRISFKSWPRMALVLPARRSE